MNPTSTMPDSEFVLRRLTEPIAFFGRELNPKLWLLIVIPVLLLGLTFVIWSYVRDSRSVGWYWAAPLGLLRSLVYVILAGVFLLPAWQYWETAEKRSRVVVLLDVSPSILKVSDELPSEGAPTTGLPTRLDRVVEFLTDDQLALVKRLTDKNPVVVYRFGGRLDDEPHTFTTGQQWSKDDWLAWAKLDLKPWLKQGLSDDGRRKLEATDAFLDDKPGTPEWATAWLLRETKDRIPANLTPEDQEKLEDNVRRLDKRLDIMRQLLNGTNVPDSALAAVGREANNMVQGLVIISDGRSNAGSESAIGELRARAKRENIPIYTVLVGEDRVPVGLHLTDVSHPERTPPDEKFKIFAEVDGPGLAGQDVKVKLDVFKPGDDPKKDPKKEPVYSVETSVPFQPGEPPHAQAEYIIDPDKLPDDLIDRDKWAKEKKREMLEGEWHVRATVVPDEKQRKLGARQQVSEVSKIQVLKRPLRVLLFASGPNREYQFLRTLFVRERDQQRAEISIYLQNEGGKTGQAVQDVEAERLLDRFPGEMNVNTDDADDADNPDKKAKWRNLAKYDVIIAFDPNWSELTAEQILLLQKWVEEQAGGLIVVGGRIHTYELARAEEGSKLKPILQLLPVKPGDSELTISKIDNSGKPSKGRIRVADVPYRLNFPGASPETDFLKLDDEKPGALAGWEEYFTGDSVRKPGVELERGFFNTYPCEPKEAATVVATFADPDLKTPKGEAPFLTAMKAKRGKVTFIGSAEMWRLRSFNEGYYERFWLKLARYVSSGSRQTITRLGQIVMSRQFTAGNYVRIEAQLKTPSLDALPKDAKVALKLIPPGADAVKGPLPKIRMEPKPTGGEWDGWFAARFPVTQVGDYKVELEIPGSNGVVLKDKFNVKESNPELDNVRPDANAMYAMASDFDDAIKRSKLDKSTLDEYRKRLDKGRTAGGDPTTAEKRTGPTRMYFPTFKDAEIIPAFMEADRKFERNRGPVEDLWDKGFEIPPMEWMAKLVPSQGNKPIHLPYVLTAVVGLLSLEWLTRKLLRLA